LLPFPCVSLHPSIPLESVLHPHPTSALSPVTLPSSPLCHPGLLMLGQSDSELAQTIIPDLLNYTHDTSHEKIVRLVITLYNFIQCFSLSSSAPPSTLYLFLPSFTPSPHLPFLSPTLFSCSVPSSFLSVHQSSCPGSSDDGVRQGGERRHTHRAALQGQRCGALCTRECVCYDVLQCDV
jgi:hypothetical protein